MNDDIAISVSNLSKCYHLYESPMDRLKQALWGGSPPKEFWALRDVSFTVKKGESVGIIGRNGSGKSTLLQILAGTLKPTSGEVVVNGRVAALLELGSGFNPEYTGRENVFLNGAILGLNRGEIQAKFDEIAAFAEIGEFMEQPVKEYSSGMMMRLAFAVQVVVEPDILIVDEALSVGDYFFQQKCMRRIRRLREVGKTILFVSHDMATIRDLCPVSAFLKQGQVVFVGENTETIRQYLADGSDGGGEGEKDTVFSIQIPNDVVLTQYGLPSPWWEKKVLVDHPESYAEILAVGLYDDNGQSSQMVRIGGEIIFKVLYRVFTAEPVHVSVLLKNKYDQLVTCISSHTLNVAPPQLERGGRAVFEMRIRCMLEAGLYSFVASLGCPDENDRNRGKVVDETPWMGPLQVVWDYETETPPFFGMFGLPVSGAFVSVCDGR